MKNIVMNPDLGEEVGEVKRVGTIMNLKLSLRTNADEHEIKMVGFFLFNIFRNFIFFDDQLMDDSCSRQ